MVNVYVCGCMGMGVNEAFVLVALYFTILSSSSHSPSPFSIALSVFAVFQVIIIALDLMILCYHPRDTLEQILYKSGTLAKSKGNANV